MLPERAFWPLPPRPAVLPRPDPWPRPTRFLRCQLLRGRLRLFSVDMALLPSLLCATDPGRLARPDVARLAPHRRLGFLADSLAVHQVAHREHHPPRGRTVLEHPLLAHSLQAEANHGAHVHFRRSGNALYQLDPVTHGFPL